MPDTLIDSHTHIDMAAFDEDREEVLERSRAARVSEWVVPAISPDTARRILAASWRTNEVHVAAGIHPHEIADASDSLLDEVDDLAADSRVVAVGEAGLDFHYGADSAPKQQRFLERQFAIAERAGKPLIIHTRDGAGMSAYEPVLAMIETTRASGVLHSFSGTAKQARRAIESGWYIGIGGIVTFKKSGELRETLRTIPPESILLETDAPYLAPVPNRGKRNEPAFLRSTATVVAEVLALDLNKLIQTVTNNTRRLFSI